MHGDQEMNSYIKQAKFVQDLSNAITEFIPSTIMPESSWTFYVRQIFYAPFEFTLTYLTAAPNQDQADLQSYGTSIISPEYASPVNLPYLSASEIALLRIFGIYRALTLHPSSNRQIHSIFSGKQFDLPDTGNLSYLASLFYIALSKAGVPDKYPFLVFAQGQHLIEVYGKCAGHRLAAAFAPNNACINLGVGNFYDPQVCKNYSRIEYRVFGHISTVPLLSRYFENVTRDLYDRNAGSVKLQVIKEVEAQTNDNLVTDQPGLYALVTLMKTKRQNKKSYQCQFFKRDQFGNCYLNTPYLETPMQDSKTEVYMASYISLPMSRYIRYFPSLKYGPLSATIELSSTVYDAWNIFNHLPAIAKQRGTAVESIVVHEICPNPIVESDFVNELNKLTVRMTKYYSLRETCNDSGISLLEYEHKCDLLNIILTNYNLNLRFNEIPTENALCAIYCTTHFGTAAVHSFTDEMLDMDEAMIWAFNAVYRKAVSTTVGQYTQLVENFSQMSEPRFNEDQIDELKAFVLSPKAYFDTFDFSLAKEYEILGQCPPCCCLCRCGELFLAMTSSDALNFAKDIISELKFRNLQLRRFDALNYSVIYQKLVQINQIRENLTNNFFMPYVPHTVDQVLRAYAEFNATERTFDQLMKAFYFYQLIYLILQFAYNTGILELSTYFVQYFVSYMQKENAYQDFPVETVPFASHMASAYFRSLKLSSVPIMYPFSNQFIIMLIFLYLHEIYDVAQSERFIDSLRQLIYLNYKSVFYYDQQFLENQLNLTYFVKFCAFQGLYWNFIRNMRQLCSIEPQETRYKVIHGFGYQEGLDYIARNVFNHDFNPYLAEINNISLLYENMHFTSDFYQISLLQAKLLLSAITPFEPDDREIFKRKLNSHFDCWELVLNSISPSEINNLPHRFYAQFLGGDVRKSSFHVSFKDMICCGMVETVPFRAFGK